MPIGELPRRMTNVLYRANRYVDFRAGMPDPVKEERISRLEHLSARKPSGDAKEKRGAPGGGGGGGALKLLNGSNQVFTTVSSFTLDGIFTASYRNYLLVIEITDTSAAAFVRLQLRVAGVTNITGYDANYAFQSSDDSTTSAKADNQANVASWQMGLYGINATNDHAIIWMEVASPQAVNRTLATWRASLFYTTTAVEYETGSGGHRTVAAYDGFVLSPSSGTFSGTAKVYGYGDT